MAHSLSTIMVSRVAAAGLAGTIALAIHSAKIAAAPNEDGTPRQVRVEVVHPERKPIRQTVEEPGQVKPYEETPVYARVAGYVRSVEVDMGDRVKGPRFDAQGKEIATGQTLLRMYIPELEDDVRRKAAGIAQARATVEQARASILVAEAEVVSAQAIATEADAAVKRTLADRAKWLSEFKRVVELATKRAVTEKLVDETRDQLAAAEASGEEAQAKRKSAEAAIAQSRARLSRARSDLVAAEAGVQSAEADHARAATLVQYGVLRAPFDGVVTRRNVHTGHTLEAGAKGEPLLILMRTDVLRVLCDVPEGDADRIKTGSPVQIRVPALSDLVVSGTVTRTADALDVNTRTLRVESDVANTDGRLRPGLYAYMTLVVGERRNAIVLPATAILGDGGRSFCSCVEAGQIVRKPVVIGLRTKNEVEITQGLQGDEQVVRVNSPSLSPGLSVEAVPYVAPK